MFVARNWMELRLKDERDRLSRKAPLILRGVTYRWNDPRFLFQLSELEQRVLEAEGRADEAEDKVQADIIIDISRCI